jgi:hypothetical protein
MQNVIEVDANYEYTPYCTIPEIALPIKLGNLMIVRVEGLEMRTELLIFPFELAVNDPFRLAFWINFPNEPAQFILEVDITTNRAVVKKRVRKCRTGMSCREKAHCLAR